MKTSLERAREMAAALYSKGGEDILIINVEDMTIIADYFVICSGRSNIQVKALCDNLEDKMAESEILPTRKEGYSEGRWIVLDYSDILVHIFLQEEREFYNIERLWNAGANCTAYSGE